MAQGPEMKLLEVVVDKVLPQFVAVEDAKLVDAKPHRKDITQNGEGLSGAADPLAKANCVLWYLCEAAPEDPSEYGGIRRHCISFYKDYLKGLQAFFDLLSDGIHQNEASPHMYKRLRDALAVLDDLALRWWRVLASPKDVSSGFKGLYSMTSNALEASQHRLLEMVHEAEDLSNVKNEFLNSYCTFSLTLIACSLCDLFQDVCNDIKAAPPYDEEATKAWIARFLKDRKNCKEQFTEANLGRQFNKVSDVLKTLDNKQHQSKSVKGRGEALDLLKVELEDSSKVILTKADHGRFALMFNKDFEAIKMKILESSDAASGSSSKGDEKGKKHEKAKKRDPLEDQRAEISLGLRTAVLAFGANWLLQHCRSKSECATAVEGQEREEGANLVSSASSATAVRPVSGDLQKKKAEEVETKSAGTGEQPLADKADDTPSAKGRQEGSFLESGKGAQGFLKIHLNVEEAAASLNMYNKYLQDTGALESSGYQTLAPFLPLLPDFLIGVELSAGKWPSHDITRVLDVARDSEVNLQTLVEELRVQAKAAPAYRTYGTLVEDIHRFSRTVHETWISVGPARNAAASVEDIQTLGLALLDLGIVVCRLWKALLGSTSAFPMGGSP